MPFLTNAAEGSILFIDEIHRLPKRGRGIHLPGHGRLPGRRRARRGDVGPDDQSLARRSSRSSGPRPAAACSRPAARAVRHARAPRVLRRRRPGQIITINAAKLRSTLVAEAAWELAARSRGTPRIANARLRWVRDYALPALTAISASRSPATPSTCKRSTPRGSTSKTGATWRP